MNHKDILMQCAVAVGTRGITYGEVDEMFDNAATIASIITGKKLTKYDVTSVMEAVKLARRRTSPGLDDNYVDGINYTSFSAQFAAEAFAKSNESTSEEAEIAAMAKRLAPLKKEEMNAKPFVKFDGSHTSVVQPGVGK